VIVATFASNIARIQQVLDAAADMNRDVSVIGRSMEQNFRIATELGYLTYEPSRIISKDRIKDYEDGKLVIATTGAQGEPMAGLARMANRDHRFVEIQPGDTVIVSASPIPGNEEYVSRTIDNLFKAGANVYYHTIKRAHVSGHASQEELKLMLGLTKPKHFIPIHGEFRMQVQHGRLAIETGVDPANVFIIENGTPIELFADGSARRGSPVTAGYVSSQFGSRTDPFTGRLAFHKGVDFAGRAGADVVAVASGVVIWSGPRFGYGDMVEVNHGNGYVTRYAHNADNLVAVGDTVRRGQVIARMGDSGRATGPNLHFEVLLNDKVVDPLTYIGR